MYFFLQIKKKLFNWWWLLCFISYEVKFPSLKFCFCNILCVFFFLLFNWYIYGWNFVEVKRKYITLQLCWLNMHTYDEVKKKWNNNINNNVFFFFFSKINKKEKVINLIAYQFKAKLIGKKNIIKETLFLLSSVSLLIS